MKWTTISAQLRGTQHPHSAWQPPSGWPQSTLSTRDKALTSMPAAPQPHGSSPWRPPSDSLSGDLFILDISHKWNYRIFCLVQFSCSVVSDSLRPHELQHARPLSITNSRSSLWLTSIESVMPSSHLILCHPLLLLPPTPPSITVFSNESTLPMRWSI